MSTVISEMLEIMSFFYKSRDVRVVPNVRVGSGTRRVGFWSSPEIIGCQKWSGTRPQLRIPVAASDIRINRVYDATRAFNVIGYLLQLSGTS